MSEIKNKIVEEVYTFNSTAGTLYGLKIEGEQYGTYKTKPLASAGDTVSFRYKVNGKYKNVDMKTLEVVAGVPPQQAAVQGNNGVAKRPYVDNQPIIARQAALNTAIAFVAVLARTDALPGIKKTSTPEDKYSVIEVLVNEKADEFYRASMAGVAPGGEMPAATGTEEVQAKADADGKWQ